MRATVTLPVLLFLCAATAEAQSPADVALADSLFHRARAMMAEGKASEACPLLVESQRLDPGGGTLMNLSRCYDAIGKTASAWTALGEALTLARRAKRDDAVRLAETKLAELSGRLSYLTIDVPSSARGGGLVVRRDGEAFAETAWGVEAPIDPGDHVIEATASGRIPWSITIHVDDRAHVRALVPPLTPIAVASAYAPVPSAALVATTNPPAADAAPASTTPSAPASHTAAYAFGAVALVAAGIGTYFGLRAMSLKSQRDEVCTGGLCDSQGRAVETSALHASTFSTIAFAVAIGAAGTSTYFFVSASKPAASVALGGSFP